MRPFAALILVVTLAVAATGVARAQQCPDGTPAPCPGDRRAAAPAAPVLSSAWNRITSTGIVRIARISPDGNFVAYLENAGPGAPPSASGIRVQNLSSGARPVTVLPIRGPRTALVRDLYVAPDGRQLLIWSDSGVFTVPAMGGTLQRLTDRQRARLSPAGDRLVSWRGADLKQVTVTSILSGDSVSFTPPGDWEWLNQVFWTGDGSALLILTNDGSRHFSLRLVSLRGRLLRVVLEDTVPLGPAGWSRSAGAFYYGRQAGAGSQLWKLPMSAAGVPTQRPSLVLPMLEAQNFGSVSESGTFAWARPASSAINIWQQRTDGDTTRRWVTRERAGVRYLPKYSPDGRRIAYAQDEGASASLWVTAADSGTPEQVAQGEGGIVWLSWSPDGQRIALCRTSAAGPRVDVVTLASGASQRLPTHDVSGDCTVGWLSADEVLYQLTGNRNYAVQSVRGGPERRLLPRDSVGSAFFPHPDPTGRYLAVSGVRHGETGARPQRVWLFSRADSSERALSPRGFGLRWSATGDAYFAFSWESSSLLRIPVAGPDSATVVRGCPGRQPADVSPDGRWVLCVEGAEAAVSDLWVVEHFDPTAPVRPAVRRR